jgi:hypothetical protein
MTHVELTVHPEYLQNPRQRRRTKPNFDAGNEKERVNDFQSVSPTQAFHSQNEVDDPGRGKYRRQGGQLPSISSRP